MGIPQSDTPDIQPVEPSQEIASTIVDEQESRGRRSWAARLLRLLLLLLVIGAVGVGVYFGWPVVFDRYIRPVETNTQDLTSLSEQLDEARSRIQQLEGASAVLRSDVDSLSSDQSAAAERIDGIAEAIEAHDDRLDQLDEISDELGIETSALAAALGREVDLVHSMELLSRARLFLYQANYGLAAQDLNGARNLLAALEPADDEPVITETIRRIDFALAALPDRPVAASDDLDIAWQTLLGTLPQPALDPVVPEPATSTTTTPPTTAP